MAYRKVTIVLPASQKNAANQWIVDNVDPQGANTFCFPYTTGTSLTHYVSIGMWSDEQAADLETKYGTKAYEGDPQEILASLSLTPFTH